MEAAAQRDAAGPTAPSAGRRSTGAAAAADLRPERLSSQFPRIANALAVVWNEPNECQAVLDKLLDDGRTERTGFPPPVRNELITLRTWVVGLSGWNEPF